MKKVQVPEMVSIRFVHKKRKRTSQEAEDAKGHVTEEKEKKNTLDMHLSIE
jgi:hypothetical protein